MTPPETRYAKSGEVRIAYHVVDNGPLDLVYVPGFVSNIDLFWEMPHQANFFGRLAAFSRLILFDKRGTGLSDRDVGIATLEERMDDLRAVMDAVGSERAALFGASEGGAMSLLFAATYPQRTRALMLYGSYARPSHLLSDEEFNKGIERIDRLWGTSEYLTSRYMPGSVSEEGARQFLARLRTPGRQPVGGNGDTSHEPGDRCPPCSAGDPGAHLGHAPGRRQRDTTTRCGSSWPASAARRSRIWATVFSRLSTDPRARCAAPPPFASRCGRSASRCAAGCTPARSS